MRINWHVRIVLVLASCFLFAAISSATSEDETENEGNGPRGQPVSETVEIPVDSLRQRAHKVEELESRINRLSTEVENLRRELARLRQFDGLTIHGLAESSGWGALADISRFPPFLEPNLAPTQLVRRRFRELEAEVKRLIRIGEAELSAELQQRLDHLQSVLRGEAIFDATEQAEVHVVGIYESSSNHRIAGSATVQVTYTQAPVVLCVTAYETTRWTIECAPDVELQQILVGGYKGHSVAESPPGVPVSILTRPVAGHRALPEEYERVSSDSTPSAFPLLAEQLKALTGLDVATLTGCYNPDNKPLVVGAENALWREESVLQRLNLLYCEALQSRFAELYSQLQEWEFQALWYASDGSIARGTFTPFGPLISTLSPVPGRSNLLAIDPAAETWYGCDGSSVARFDGPSLTGSELIPGDDLPEFRWLSAMAVDTTRNRLVVSSGDFVFAYSFDKQEWLVLRPSGPRVESLVYVPERDVLYGVCRSERLHGRFDRIVRLTPSAATVDEVQLSMPLARAERGTQLVWVDGYLALLTGMQSTASNQVQGEYPTCAIIEPQTGEVVHYSYLVPR